MIDIDEPQQPDLFTEEPIGPVFDFDLLTGRTEKGLVVGE